MRISGTKKEFYIFMWTVLEIDFIHVSNSYLFNVPYYFIFMQSFSILDILFSDGRGMITIAHPEPSAKMS